MRYLLALVLLAGCATYEPPTPTAAGPTPRVALSSAYTEPRGTKPTADDLDVLTDRFKRIALVWEIGGHYPYITKWRGHVPVYVKGSDRLSDEVITFLWQLQAITNLSLQVHRVNEPLKEITPPFIYIEEGKTHPTDAGRHCFGGLRMNEKTGEIFAASIAINPHPDISMRRCVREELAQALGARNDHPGWPDSIFNDSNTTDETLSWADAVILRALYDQRILIGMHRDDAMPIARQVISEILAEINGQTTASTAR